MRYEYYSPPYLKSGLTATIADLGDGLFGASRGAGGQLFDNWLQPGNLYSDQLRKHTACRGDSAGLQVRRATVGFASCLHMRPEQLTSIEFVGPETTNPNKTIMPRDRNNFGPAVGFAWQVPWFGEGKTTVRGGYSVQYRG